VLLSKKGMGIPRPGMCREGRRFESCRPDSDPTILIVGFFIFGNEMCFYQKKGWAYRAPACAGKAQVRILPPSVKYSVMACYLICIFN
jgi:hypothetical protein